MVQITSNKFVRGLALNSNTFFGVPGRDPYGSTSLGVLIADNCVQSSQRTMSNRRGFDYFTNPTSANIVKMLEFQNQIIEHQSDNTLWHGDPTAGTRTQYSGTYIPPTGYQIDGAVGRGSLFFTTTGGPFKLDAVGNTPQRSGLTKALDTRCTVTGTGNGLLGGLDTAAYHISWLRIDANGQQVRSDVSTRIVVTNANRQIPSSITSATGTATVTTPLAHGYTTGDSILVAGATQPQYNGTFVITSTGTLTFTYTVAGSPTSPATSATNLTVEKAMNVAVAFTVPYDVLTGDTYEVWRTTTIDATGGADPGDECFQVAAVVNVAAGGTTVTYTDTTTDSVLSSSTPLYTNETLEGSLQGNTRPPLCSAITTYKDYTLYANTSIDQTLPLNLLAVGFLTAGTSQFILKTTDGAHTRTYTGNTSENVSTQTWQIFTGGLSNAQNIQQTVQSLCHVINGDTAGFWYSEYTAGEFDQPGLFRVWARSPITNTFYANASNTTTGNQFSPALPTSATTVMSSGDTRQNRIFYSKFQQPDAVPLLNNIDVGSLDQPILRVIPVRDACYVIKTDGVYYLSGLVAPFSLTELDSTCQCLAPQSAVALNNQIFMLSNQGVVTLSLSGVTVISYDIEPAIMAQALPLPNLSAVCFGIGHEVDRSYYLFLPTAAGDSVAQISFVYQTFNQEWVRWTKPAVSGIVLKFNNFLYIASGLEKALLKQRRNGDKTDYSDEQVATTIASQTGSSVGITWSSTVFTPVVGMTLHQSASVSKVIAVLWNGSTSWTFTIDRTVTYSVAAATVRMPIQTQVRLSPNNCGESGLVKTFYAVSWMLQNNTVSQAFIECGTNEAPLLNKYPVSRISSGGWGSNPWGQTGWGDLVSAIRTIPFEMALPIPDITGEAVTTGWYHAVSQEQWDLAQVSFLFDQDSEIEATQ